MAEDTDDSAGAPLTDEEQKEVSERKSGSSRIVHEVIRLEGEEELARGWSSLMFSGLAAGVAINASVLTKAYLREGLPDAPWRPIVESLGYTVGFIIVVLGRMQLFTESTVTAVLPVASNPSVAKLWRMLRLWAVVFLSNMVGTFAVSLALNTDGIITHGTHEAILELSREVAANGAWRILMLGIPSGFLVGCIAWILPNARESQFWVVLLLAYLISLGGFSHVVAGSTELWMLWLHGEIGLLDGIGIVLIPSLVGNIVGGTLLFAVLAHGQVSEPDQDTDA